MIVTVTSIMMIKPYKFLHSSNEQHMTNFTLTVCCRLENLLDADIEDWTETSDHFTTASQKGTSFDFDSSFD